MRMQSGDSGGQRPLPVKKNDWVQSRHDPGTVGRVRDCYPDPSDPRKILIDVWMYHRDGRNLGRVSPECGGPKTFEPALDYEDWQRTSEPQFPLQLVWKPQDDGTRVTAWSGGQKILPDRAYVPKPRAPSSNKATTVNFDPEKEAAALRRAAQELRDAAREHGVPELRKRAEGLEKQAEDLCPQFGPGPTR